VDNNILTDKHLFRTRFILFFSFRSTDIAVFIAFFCFCFVVRYNVLKLYKFYGGRCASSENTRSKIILKISPIVNHGKHFISPETRARTIQCLCDPCERIYIYI